MKESKTLDLTFSIPINPKDLPMQSVRSRIVKSGGKQFVHHYQKADKVQTKLELREWFKKRVEGKVDLLKQKNAYIKIYHLHYNFPLPQKLTRKQQATLEWYGYIPVNVKPDLLDNLNKLLMDAMTGTVFYDDARIWQVMSLRKAMAYDVGVEMSLQITWEE